MNEEPPRTGRIVAGDYLLAEPEGCEWFIPRTLDPERRARILAEVAKWYGLPAAEYTIHVNPDTTS